LFRSVPLVSLRTAGQTVFGRINKKGHRNITKNVLFLFRQTTVQAPRESNTLLVLAEDNSSNELVHLDNTNTLPPSTKIILKERTVLHVLKR
jgi:hypothetical protein